MLTSLLKASQIYILVNSGQASFSAGFHLEQDRPIPKSAYSEH